MQLIRNLNCSSLLAGAISFDEDCGEMTTTGERGISSSSVEEEEEEDDEEAAGSRPDG